MTVQADGLQVDEPEQALMPHAMKGGKIKLDKLKQTSNEG